MGHRDFKDQLYAQFARIGKALASLARLELLERLELVAQGERSVEGLAREAGFTAVQTTSGPFELMTPGGFLGDKGLIRCLVIAGRALSRPAYLRKMAWLMPRINRAVPYLGSIAVAGKKPA